MPRKISFLIVFTALFSLSGYGDWAEDADCPLRMERPEIDQIFMAPIDPIVFFIEDHKGSTCKKWRDRLTKLGKYLVKLSERTVTPLPTDLHLEKDALAKEATALITQVILEAEEMTRTGESCNKKRIAETGENALVQLVRTLYAANAQLRLMGVQVHDTVKTVVDLPDFLKAVRTVFDEEKALREESFLKDACRLLKEEFNDRCGDKSPRAFGEKPRVLSAVSEARVGAAQALHVRAEDKLKRAADAAREPYGKPSFRQKVKSSFGVTNDKIRDLLGLEKAPKPEKPVKASWEMENAYYNHVDRNLKFCGLELALERFPKKPGLFGAPAKGAYESYCAPFFCKQNGLFEKPEVGVNTTESFCRFMGDFRGMEKAYLQGFLAAQTSKQKDFCPPRAQRLPALPEDQKPTLNNEHEVIRLPPIDTN